MEGTMTIIPFFTKLAFKYGVGNCTK